MKAVIRTSMRIVEKIDKWAYWIKDFQSFSLALLFLCFFTFRCDIFPMVTNGVFFNEPLHDGVTSIESKHEIIDTLIPSTSSKVEERGKHYDEHKYWKYYLLDTFFLLFYVFTSYVVIHALREHAGARRLIPNLDTISQLLAPLILMAATFDFSENTTFFIYLAFDCTNLLPFISIFTTLKMIFMLPALILGLFYLALRAYGFIMFAAYLIGVSKHNPYAKMN